METIRYYKKYFLLGGAIIILFIFSFLYFKEDKEISPIQDKVISLNSETTTYSKKIVVDVKGAVKKEGVYEFKEGDRIVDAIKKAGGLTKNATTKNINLSKLLTNEMVIYVFTKSELKSSNKNNIVTTTTSECKCETIEVNNCVEPKTIVETTTTTNNTITNNNESKLININTASINELMTLSGIGEAKAKAIVSFRETNGYFSKIDDIMKVSGLGEALFDKIKDSITV